MAGTGLTKKSFALSSTIIRNKVRELIDARWTGKDQFGNRVLFHEMWSMRRFPCVLVESSREGAGGLRLIRVTYRAIKANT